MEQSKFLLLLALAFIAFLAMDTGQASAHDDDGGGFGAVAVCGATTGENQLLNSAVLTSGMVPGAIVMAVNEKVGVSQIPVAGCSDVQSVGLLFRQDSLIVSSVQAIAGGYTMAF